MSIEMIRSDNFSPVTADRPQGGAPGTFTPDGNGRVVYRIKRGDTLSKIIARAKREFQLRGDQNLSRVAKQSGIANPNLIYTGRTVVFYLEPTREDRSAQAITDEPRPILLASLGAVALPDRGESAAPTPRLPELDRSWLSGRLDPAKQAKDFFGSKPLPKGIGIPTAELNIINWLIEGNQGTSDISKLEAGLLATEGLSPFWRAKGALLAFDSIDNSGVRNILLTLLIGKTEGADRTRLETLQANSAPLRKEDKLFILDLIYNKLIEGQDCGNEEKPEFDPLLVGNYYFQRYLLGNDRADLQKAKEHFKRISSDLPLNKELSNNTFTTIAIRYGISTSVIGGFRDPDYIGFHPVSGDLVHGRYVKASLVTRDGTWSEDWVQSLTVGIPAEFSRYQAEAHAKLAQIKMIEAGRESDPRKREALLIETHNLLVTGAEHAAGLQLLDIARLDAEVLLQLALIYKGRRADPQPLLAEARKLSDRIAAWESQYNTLLAPHADRTTPPWLVQIGRANRVTSIILDVMENKDIAQIEAALARLDLSRSEKLTMGRELALHYFNLKGNGQAAEGHYQLAVKLLREAATDPDQKISAQANLWLGKISAAEAQDVAELEAAQGFITASLAGLTAEELGEASRVQGEITLRIAFLKRSAGDELRRELNRAESDLQLAVANGDDYTKASATAWLARINLIRSEMALAAGEQELPASLDQARDQIDQAIVFGKLEGKELAQAKETRAKIMLLPAQLLLDQGRITEARGLIKGVQDEQAKGSSLYIKTSLALLSIDCRTEESYVSLAEKAGREILVAAFKSGNPELIKQAVAMVLEAHLSDPSTQKEVLPLVNFLLGLSGEERLTELGGLTTPLSQLVQLYVDPSGLYDQESAAPLYLQAAETYIGQRKFELAEAALAKARPATGAPAADRVNYELAVATLTLRRTPGKAGAEQAGDTAQAVLNGTAPTWLKAKAFLLTLEAFASQEAHQQIIELTGAPPLALTPKQQLQADFYKVDALMATKKYQEALILARGIATSTKATVQQQAEALYRMGEINRYGLDKPAEAKQNYDEALALAEGLDQLGAEIRLGQLKLLEEAGKKGEMRRTYKKVERGDLPPEKQQELRAVGAKLTEPLVSASERGAVLPDSTEYREEVAVKVPVVDLPGEAGRLSLTTRILHDRAAGTRLTTPLIGVALDDARIDGGSAGPIIASGALEVGTGPIVHQHTPGRSTRFFKQPDLTLRAGLWNQYFSVDGSMEAQIYPGRDPRIQSGYAAALHNFAWTGLPFIKDLSLGLDYGYSNFFYNNDERSRHSLALAFRMKFDPLETFGLDRYAGILTLFGRARWMPGWLFSEYLPKHELAGAATPEARQRIGGSLKTPHADWRRGSVGGGLTLDFSPLGVPISLSGEANYYNTFSHQQGGREYNSSFWDWRGTVNLDLSEPFEAFVDWIKRQ